ncbi:hypothetical protein BF698P1_00009 [Bacteroides phage BF698P1]|nr:hypothetical protein BF698P1_00009 [Bacteroides phage BF698P1]WAX07319.1 hypothetical protein BF698P3_00009 [Bacteroides phage BF698P3]
MEKKVSSTGMYETTYSGGVFVGKLSMPTKIGLTDQTKVSLLEYLTESDDFHKLVCDITGTERKQVKVSPELEKIKEDYLHVCNRYKQEQERSNYFLHAWQDEKAKRMKIEKEINDTEIHHKSIIDKISEMLKEVKCSSVRDVVGQLKAERANGKLFAEQCELLKEENDTLSKRFSDLEKSYFCIHKGANEIKNSREKLSDNYDRLKKSYDNVCNEIKEIEKNRDNLSDNYDRLAEDYEYLNKCVQNQANTITRYIEENKRLTEKVEKLKGKLDRASKRYGELIKITSDKAIKSI